jgi:hypothetical protein
LLAELRLRMAKETLDDVLREVGRRLAQRQLPLQGDLKSRATGAVRILAEIGGRATLEESEDGLVIQGQSCPLAAVVAGHPETCLMAEALLSEVVGSPVRQTCDPDVPRCRFLIEAAPLAR